MTAGAAHPPLCGRIGPNAIIRIAEALDAVEGRALTSKIFKTSGLEAYLAEPPSQMVQEDEVTGLHQALRASLGPLRAASVSWIAGQRTADYLLANRIPETVQTCLRHLPPRLASRLLMAAIARNAWTFAGSGRFSVQHGYPVQFTIADNPVCRGAITDGPACAYYAATFERLYRTLVHADARIAETACAAVGDARCTFEIRWK